MKKYYILFLLLLSLLMFSCCPEEYCSDKGVVLGLDERECACCGGWFIEIENDTFRTYTFPVEFQNTLQIDDFPLPIYLEWTMMEDPCMGDEIEVECTRSDE